MLYSMFAPGAAPHHRRSGPEQDAANEKGPQTYLSLSIIIQVGHAASLKTVKT